MPLKDHELSERRQTANKAKKEMIERSLTKAKDPATLEKRAQRMAEAETRKLRVQEREAAARAEAERKAVAERIRVEAEAKLAAEQAEQAEIERRMEGDRAIALLAEQKAARDARYASRKARRG